MNLYIDEEQARILLLMIKGVALHSAELRELIPVEVEITSALKGCRSLNYMGSKERVKQYRSRQKELDRLKREMYLTDSEFEQLKAKLAELRKSA